MAESHKRVSKLSEDQRRVLATRLLSIRTPSPSAGIPSVPRDGTPLLASFAQQRLWFVNQLEPDSTAYNVNASFRLRGPLGVPALRNALKEVVRRHESLRTTFEVSKAGNGVLIQVIRSEEWFDWEQADLDAEDAGVEEKLRRHLERMADRPFDLEQGPLFRVSLLRVSPDDHALLLSMHHIVSDLWSLSILFKELGLIYKATILNRRHQLPEARLQYADVAAWQRHQLENGAIKEELGFWERELAGPLPLLELPSDRPRPVKQSYRGAHERFVAPKQLSDQIRAICNREGVTMFMLALAAFKVLLYRYTGESDILVGSPVAGRENVQVESLIGLFINTVVIRSRLQGSLPFKQLLAQIRDNVLRALDNQSVPFEKLAERLQPERYSSHTPIFQVMFVTQNVTAQPLKLGDVSCEAIPSTTGGAKFDLSLGISESVRGIGGEFSYCTDLFDASMIQRMTGHYRQLLESIAANLDTPIDELVLMGSNERALLEAFNRTECTFSSHQSLHGLVEAQAAQTPTAEAIRFQGRSITYAELDGCANGLAAHIRGYGVGPGVLVGVCLERSLELPVALLAVLKAGGAYVPLETDLPSQRLEFLLQDSGASVVIVQSHLLKSLPATEAELVTLDSWQQYGSAGSSANVEVQLDELAYVMYTSGSTGQPKGAMNNHRGVCNRILWMTRELRLGVGDRVLQKAPLSFDVLVWEIFAPLVAGGCVVLADPGGHRDPAYLVDLVEQEQITTAHFVPSMLQSFLEQPGVERCKSLRRVFSGGEVLTVELQQAFHKRLACELHNMYGPTEAAISVAHWLCRRDDDRRSVPIGRPIANVKIHILDRDMRRVPIGSAGELCIAGLQVGRGYWKRPELTAERFVPDPYSQDTSAMLYRTGDLAKWGTDGLLFYLGRQDSQVKIRGVRIELEEVESALGGCAGVKDCAVAVHEERLVAYVVSKNRSRPSPEQLRAHLTGLLPHYMVPATFLFLDNLPLSHNGKLDRKALPAPARNSRDIDRGYVAPANEVERKLAAIWKDVLKIEEVGVTDGFFQLGGDSIISLQVVARARQSGLQFPVRDIFEFQTIEKIAARIGSAGPVTIADQGLILGSFPVTAIQRRFFEQRLAEPHHFNQSRMMVIETSIDHSVLDKVVERLLTHHDALRSCCLQNGDQWELQILPNSPVRCWEEVDLGSSSEADEAALMEAEGLRVQSSFDLKKGPLVKFVWFRGARDGADRLLIAAHHLVVDAVSWRILTEDLALLIGDPTSDLPSKTASFKAFSERLSLLAVEDSVQRDLGFWLGQDWRSLPDIPVDRGHHNRVVRVACLARVGLELSLDETKTLLQRLPSVVDVGIEEALLGSVAMGVRSWSGQNRLLVDLESHGRDEEFCSLDVSRTVGWFTAIYPVVLDVSSCVHGVDAVSAAAKQLRRIPQRGLSFGLLRYLSPSSAEKLKVATQPQVCFNYFGQLEGQASYEGIRISRERAGSDHGPQNRRPWILEIGAAVQDKRLKMNISYSSELHDKKTIERLLAAIGDQLKQIVRYCARDAEERPPKGRAPFNLASLNQRKLESIVKGLHR